MSQFDNQKPRRFTRTKTNLTWFALGASVATVVILRKYDVPSYKGLGSAIPMAWVSKGMEKQIMEKGSAMVEYSPGRYCDLIDWAHPVYMKK